MLDDITVSRRHADDRAHAARATSCSDAGSLNGTYVNQERIDRARAAPRRRAADRQVPPRVLRADRWLSRASAAYLSIGEVLGLLLEEFPDVTISKIRFLESQGLIEPERTPSGYRKFYDDDVELLRVILREQRENFLPLRVIKDRIDSGEIDRTGDAAARRRGTGGRRRRRHADARPTTDRRRPSSRPAPAARRRGRRPSPPRPAPRRARRPTRRRHVADARASRSAPAAPSPRLLPGVLVNRDELCAMASVTREQLAAARGVRRRSPSAGRARRPVRRRRRRDRRRRRRVPARRRRGPPPAGLAHVRRREAGLFEQLILPLLRQRNPQARAAGRRAHSTSWTPSAAELRDGARCAPPCASTSSSDRRGPLRRPPWRAARYARDVVPLELVGVRVEVPANTPMVLLREQDGRHRLLPIYIGTPEATAIHYALEGDRAAPPADPRPVRRTR